MLREYLISEAMHALGIPSTRSLSVVETGATVQRETPLKGAVLLRVAASHLRVGTFNGRQLNPSSSGSANSWITRFKGTILNARRTPILQEAFWSISCKDRSHRRLDAGRIHSWRHEYRQYGAFRRNH